MSIQQMLSFSVNEYRNRIAKARKSMVDLGVDALLVHDFPNICYLSGYQSWNILGYYAFLLPADEEPALLLWKSEQGNAHVSSWVTNYYTYPTGGDPVALTIDMLKEYNLDRGKVGVELNTPHLLPSAHQRIVRALPKATFVDCSGLIQNLRAIKSQAELEHIRRAARMTDAGMQAAIDAVHAGAIDQEIAVEAYKTLIAAGSEYMCVQPVVCAGMLSGVPHANYRGVTIREGGTVLLELSGCVHRYNAPIMRSAVVGPPSEEVKRMADAILKTLNAVIEAMRPEVELDGIARMAEPIISKAGPTVMELFHHCYAYSIGLGFMPNWADAPLTITKGAAGVLEPGMVFHLPISLRDPGRYGVAMSETVIITETGKEVVTTLERTLFQR